MKAILALIFLACIAGSMASDPRIFLFDNLLQQGLTVTGGVMNHLHQQISTLAENALSAFSTLIGPFGRFDVNTILDQFKEHLTTIIGQALGSIVNVLPSFLGGRAAIDLHPIFHQLLQEIMKPITQIASDLIGPSIGAAIGMLGRSRGINDLFAGLQQQISGAITTAQGILSGALGNISAIGSNILDASKPHWEQLQEQLVGHGLNALGSLSESISNIHGSITNGR